MTIPAGSPVFIDTNVLVFATIPASLRHQDAIVALHQLSLGGTPGWISRSAGSAQAQWSFRNE